MARLSTANDIINRAAVEMSLPKSNNPVSSTDESFIQLTELLNACGQELVELHPWQILMKSYEVTTQEGDSGVYDLPSDFSEMIDQTGWEHSQSVPIGGPLSAQDWSYLDGRDLVSQSIYASFRLVDNKFTLYPQPPPTGLDIRFQYISRNWVADQANTQNRHDLIETGSDVVLFEPIMTVKFLKVKFLAAKGFDTSAAALDFENMFNSRTGKDEGAMILSASNSGYKYPYINPYRNVGDTGYGT